MIRKRKFSKPIPLSDEQRTLLNMILKENFELSDREFYVIQVVLERNEYHPNYQYHLTKIRDRWTKYYANKLNKK